MALDKRDSETRPESPWKFHALRREDAVTARSFTPRMARAVASMLTGRRKSSMPVALRTTILERMDVPTCVQLPTCDAEGECANDDEVKCLGQNWRRLRHQLRRGALGELTAAQKTPATARCARINQVLTACSCRHPTHVPRRRGCAQSQPQNPRLGGPECRRRIGDRRPRRRAVSDNANWSSSGERRCRFRIPSHRSEVCPRNIDRCHRGASISDSYALTYYRGECLRTGVQEA